MREGHYTPTTTLGYKAFKNAQDFPANKANKKLSVQTYSQALRKTAPLTARQNALDFYLIILRQFPLTV